MMPLTLYIDDVLTEATELMEPLVRSVVISLFTNRRANIDDELPGDKRFGWWGDTFPVIDNDRIGSRLWLLDRGKLTTETVERAKEYAEESLQWLLDDNVAESITVVSERQSLDRLAVGVIITRGDKSKVSIRFQNVWDYINV
jgi:phage gp46-like protein